jgi:hypothetical protein
MKKAWGLTGMVFALGLLPWPAWASGKPDWKVTEITAERTQSSTTPLKIKVVLKVKNSGSATSSGQFITRLEYRNKSSDPWNHLFDWHGGATAAGGGARYENSFDFNEGGSFTFKATVDPDDAIDETSEGNNTKSVTKTFEAGTPDLTVQNISAHIVKVLPNGSHKVKVEWDVVNIGTGKAKPSFVTVLEVSKNYGGWVEVQRYTKSSLNPGASQHYSKEGTYTDFSRMVFKATADDTAKVHEIAEGNNFATSNEVKP